MSYATLPVAEKVEWLRFSTIWSSIYYIYSLVSIGILPAICLFNPTLKVRLQTQPCKPHESEIALVTIQGTEYFAETQLYKSDSSQEVIVSFEANTQRFSASSFDDYILVAVPMVPPTFPDLLLAASSPPSSSSGSAKERQEERNILQAKYGENIMYLPEISSCELLIKHALSPFFLFQYFAVIIWLVEEYYVYSFVIFFITVASIYFVWSESVFNLERLRSLACRNGSATILQAGRDVVLPDTSLVVGDCILVQLDETMPCDCVLICGRVIMDEAALTGESTPVSKTPIEIADLNGGQVDTDIATKRSGSMLSGGTKVKACIGRCVAVCYRTGFRSAKGQLVAMLLSPKEGFVNFVSDALWVILFMLVLTTVLYSYIATELISMGASSSEVLLKYLDAITIAVPPALPACLTVATAIAIERLKLKQIFVSDTNRVNFGGTINVACFDKTGTLTDETMDLICCLVARNPLILERLIQTSSEHDPTWKTVDQDEKSDFLTCNATTHYPTIVQQVMATCQNLSLLGHNEMQAVGDPLEVELLRASGWTLTNGPAGLTVAYPPTANSKRDIDSQGYRIARHFEFTPERLRAASIVQRPFTDVSIDYMGTSSDLATHYLRLHRSRLVYLVKGSPEAIVGLCESSSVPPTIQASLLSLAKRGLRVIAIAGRAMREDEFLSSQDQIEGSSGVNSSPMLFLGLLCLSSRLKTSTKVTIKSLIAANVATSMITGDHIHTGIAVAQQAGILLESSELANKLYIVDESSEPGEPGAPIIIDSHTDNVIQGMELETLISSAARCQDTLYGEFLAHLSESPSHLTSNDNVQIACTGKGLASVLRNCPTVNENDENGVPTESVYRSLIRYTRVFARTKPADKKTIVAEMMNTLEYDCRQWRHYNNTTSNALFEHVSSKIDVEMGSGGGATQDLATTKRPLSPEEKYEVSLGNCSVLFCGDGANDMSALRHADVGVSLCDAETSVAAPITSKMQTPLSVIEVLLESRCSLVTAYVLVLYMIMYGVIQLFMSLELYSFGLIPSDYSYLIQDLFFTLVLGICIALTERSEELHWQLPPKRVLVWWLIFILGSQVITFIAFQILALYALSLQSWYVPYEAETVLVDSYAYESSTIANVALAQLMIGSVAATIGSPFRKPWYVNKWHVLVLVPQAAWVLYQIFQTGDYFATSWLKLKPLPFNFGMMLVGLIGCNALVSTLFYYLAECLRPAPRKKIYHEVDRMMTLSKLCAEERDALYRELATPSHHSIAMQPNTNAEVDDAPLLSPRLG